MAVAPPDPAQWLQSGPGAITKPEHVREILDSFSSLPKISRLQGPEVLIRAVGKSLYWGYWVRQSQLFELYRNLGQFVGWLTSEELSRKFEWRYRAYTAVCVNWNDFSEFAELRLPRGEGINCLIGSAAPQPLNSMLDPNRRDTPILRGGMEQIFFRSGDASPFWVERRSKHAIF